MQDVNPTTQIQDTTLHRFGSDYAIEGYLHDPYKFRASLTKQEKS
jgi:hypothetical protein